MPGLERLQFDPKDTPMKEKILVETLDKIERIWLEDGKKKYLCNEGEKISVADIFAICELIQTTVVG